MEGLSSLDFRALFFPCSGSFSGAPASKATPFDHSEIKKTTNYYNRLVVSLQYIYQSGILAKVFMDIVLASGLASALLSCVSVLRKRRKNKSKETEERINS